MDDFLASHTSGNTNQHWYQKNLSAFIKVCKAHGETALQHHHMLISKFIEQPAQKADLSSKADLTASGPPLPVMLKGLKKLCDLRSAAKVDGLATRHQDLQVLRQTLKKV